jgi:hypothetical protein
MQTHALPALRSHPPARGSRRWNGQDRPGDGTRAGQRSELMARLGARPGLIRRARLVALAVGGFLLPWSVLLAVTLPAAATAQHWALAWSGLDVAEAAAALATAALLARGDRRASLPAAAGGTLLLLDAWFDVCTSAPGAGQAMALAEAGCLEIPLAAAAWWVAIVLTRESR